MKAKRKGSNWFLSQTISDNENSYWSVCAAFLEALAQKLAKPLGHDLILLAFPECSSFLDSLESAERLELGPFSKDPFERESANLNLGSCWYVSICTPLPPLSLTTKRCF